MKRKQTYIYSLRYDKKKTLRKPLNNAVFTDFVSSPFL